MEKIKALIKRHEGLNLKPYLCTSGNLTIGYGRNLTDNGITETEAEDMLSYDIAEANFYKNTGRESIIMRNNYGILIESIKKNEGY